MASIHRRVLGTASRPNGPTGIYRAATYVSALGVGTQRYCGAWRSLHSLARDGYNRPEPTGHRKEFIRVPYVEKASVRLHRSRLTLAEFSPHRTRSATLYHWSNGRWKATNRMWGFGSTSPPNLSRSSNNCA